jgi:hypothetical protein
MAQSQDGNAVVYAVNQSVPEDPEPIEAYLNGTSAAAPMLSNTTAATADITASGSAVLYTLDVLSGSSPYYTPASYPGVYEWEPSG